MTPKSHTDGHARDPAPGLRAPLLPAAAGVALGVTVSECAANVSAGPAMLLFVASCAALVLLARRKTAVHHSLFIALIVVAAGALGYWRHQVVTHLPPDHVAHVVDAEPILARIEGQIVTSPTHQAGTRRNPFIPFDPPPQARFVVAASSVHTGDGARPLSGYVRVTLDSPGAELRLGDRVRLTGKLFRPRGARNPGETDWAAQMRLQDIYAGMAIESAAHVQVLPRETSGLSAIDRVRAFARSLLFEPSVAADHGPAVRVLDSMVLGQRSAVGQEINDAFLRTGVIHFLSVSGAHVAALAGGVYWLLRRVLGAGAKPTAVVSMLTMLAYLLLAEPNAPILRATLMGVCICIATLIDRPIAPLNWLSLAGLLLLARPLDLFQAGFQLSFVQVAVMIVVLPRLVSLRPVRRATERPAEAANWIALARAILWRWIRAASITSLVCWAAAIPLSLHHFRMFTLWAALHSLILSPLIVAITLLSFVAMFVRAATFGVVTVVGDLVLLLTDGLLYAVDWLASWPGTLFEWPAPPIVVIFGLYVAGCWVLRWLHSRSKGTLDDRSPRADGVHHLTFAAAIPVLAWIPGAVAIRPVGDAASVVVLAVGSGSATVVVDDARRAALIDVGTIHNFDVGNTAFEALRDLGIGHVEWVSISHDNFDHYSGLPTLLQRADVRGVLTHRVFADALNRENSREPLAREISVRRPNMRGLQLGERLKLGVLEFDALWPPADLPATTDENDRSLVLRMSAAGRTVLLPGDIERVAIRGLLDLHEANAINLRSDVLVAPHHGSIVQPETAALLEAVLPEVLIVSTSKPRDELFELVRETLGASCRVMSTEDMGAVTVRVKRDGRMFVEGFAERP